MASDFQIQEMIHQDEDGVLFQALDKQTGHLVALRRFFLKDEVVAKLQEKGEGGKTLFEEGLEWMRSLEVPNLQAVVGGGFDELDGTPYFVTKWIDGMSLAEGHEKEIFSEGEGEVFEAQARAVLLALPAESRPAVCLDEEEILVGRDEAGALVTFFLLSPMRYFGAMGGMEFEGVDRSETLRLLVEDFPVQETASSPLMTGSVSAASPAPGPVLKSAQKSGSGGLLWGGLVGLLAILGVGGWLIFSNSKSTDDKEDVVAGEQEKEVPGKREDLKTKRGEVASVELREEEEREPVEASEPEKQESVVLSQTDAEIAAARAAKARQELEEAEKPVVMTPPKPGAYTVDDSRPEGEVDLFEDESGSRVEKAADGTVGPDEIEILKEMDGKAVTFAGKVVESNQSGSGKTWYLDFGDRRTQAFVAFLHTRTPEEEKKADWEAFVGKEIFVKGKVTIDRGRMARGSGVKIMIEGLADISLKPEEPEEKRYQFSDLDDLRVVSEGEEIVFEGEFRDFKVRKPYVYLYFVDSFAIVGRFDVGGALSNREFADRLQGFKGERIRLRGIRKEDENDQIEIVIHLADSSNLSAAD